MAESYHRHQDAAAGRLPSRLPGWRPRTCIGNRWISDVALIGSLSPSQSHALYCHDSSTPAYESHLTRSFSLTIHHSYQNNLIPTRVGTSSESPWLGQAVYYQSSTLPRGHFVVEGRFRGRKIHCRVLHFLFACYIAWEDCLPNKPSSLRAALEQPGVIGVTNSSRARAT